MVFVIRIANTNHSVWDWHLDVCGSDAEYNILLRIIMYQQQFRYRQTFNRSWTLVGNKVVDHSDVVGASPVGAAPNTTSFST